MFQTSSAAQTRRLGECIGRTARAGDIVLLYGELGTGKTVFVQGMAKGLKVTDRPTSPSFTIVHEYAGTLAMYHVDLYRLEPAQVAGIGIEQYIAGDGVTVIEWAERLPENMRKQGLSVEMSFGARKNGRTLRFAAADDRSAELLQALDSGIPQP